MILGLVDHAVASGASQKAACGVLEITERALQRWRKQGIGDDNRAGPRTTPGNQLSKMERQKALSILNSEEFRDLSPWQVVPALADRGQYVALAIRKPSRRNPWLKPGMLGELSTFTKWLIAGTVY